jgi:hypothetical protein
MDRLVPRRTMAVTINGEPPRLLGFRQGPELRIVFQHPLSGVDKELGLLTHGQDAVEGLIALIRSRLACRSGVGGIDINDDAPESRVAVTDDLVESEFGGTELGHAIRERPSP